MGKKKSATVIAERRLEIRKDGQERVAVPICIFAPTQSGSAWSCRYEIEWPDSKWAMDIFGIDAVQALELALRGIGSELYSSEFHKRGELIWLKAGTGYGFPVMSTFRDHVVGDDKGFFE
jgi:hypothetical protein